MTILVSNDDEWFQHLTNLEIHTVSEPHDFPEIGIRLFLAKDPENTYSGDPTFHLNLANIGVYLLILSSRYV